MPMIMIRCPTLDKGVPTGLNTEKIKFDSLSGIPFVLVCPACGKIHRWRKPDALIERDQDN
jgi:hypothetical protein